MKRVVGENTITEERRRGRTLPLSPCQDRNGPPTLLPNTPRPCLTPRFTWLPMSFAFVMTLRCLGLSLHEHNTSFTPFELTLRFMIRTSGSCFVRWLVAFCHHVSTVIDRLCTGSGVKHLGHSGDTAGPLLADALAWHPSHTCDPTRVKSLVSLNQHTFSLSSLLPSLN